MAGVFGKHEPGIPYRPIAELFAMYRARDPNKTAIVDLDTGSSITFGQLEQVTTDIAAFLKSKGVRKGDRVLLLSDECLEKLLIWFGTWRIGAVVCPLNIEINEKEMVELARAVNPALILYHKELDLDALVGNHPAPRMRFGAWSATAPRIRRTNSSQRCQGATARRRCPSVTMPTIQPASSARRARRRGPRSWSTTMRLLAQRPRRRWNSSASAKTTARSNTARSAGIRRRC